MSRKMYTVQKGDTLWGIGKHYNLTVKQLAEWNHIYGKKIHKLSIGQKIFLQPEGYDDYETFLIIRLLDINFKPINKATLMVEYDGQCKTISVNNSHTDEILIRDRHSGIKVFFYNLKKEFVLIAHHTVLPMGKKKLTLTSRMMKVSGNNLPEKGHQLEKLKDLSKVLEKENQQPTPPIQKEVESQSDGNKSNQADKSKTSSKAPTKTNNQNSSVKDHNEVIRTDGGIPTHVVVDFYNDENLKLHSNNEIYRQFIISAAKRHGFNAPTTAAIINAESAKIGSGSLKGRWKADSQNSTTSAGGMTQMLDGTWRDISKRSDSLLYKYKQKHPNLTDAQLLKLKYNPELSIDAGMVYAKMNIESLNKKLPLAKITNKADLAKIAYFTHHEGATGAYKLIKDKYKDSDFMKGKLIKQIGNGNLLRQYMKEANQNGVKAYHAWIRDYIDTQINVENFMVKVPENYCVNGLDSIITQLGGTSYSSKNKDTCPADSSGSSNKTTTIPSNEASTTNKVGGNNKWRNPLNHCQVRRFGYRSLPLTKGASSYNKNNLYEATHKASRFGKTNYRSAGKHQGIDLEAEPNTPIYPVCVGKIVFARLYGSGNSYGKAIILRCNVDDLPKAKQDIVRNQLKFKEDIIYFVYCHLNRIDVSENDLISDLNKPIGLSGNSGNAKSMTSISKGSHLHFEVRNEVKNSLGVSGLNYRYPPFPLLDNCYTTENGVK